MSSPPQPGSSRPPIRIWPGVIIVALLWLLRFAVPAVFPDAAMVGLIGGGVCALALTVWWLFFSRASWTERIGTIVAMVLVLTATKRVVHPSVAGGMMGLMLPIYALPTLCLGLVAAVVVARRFSAPARRVTLFIGVLLACGVWTLVRTAGIASDATSDFQWRWSKTPEERLVAQSREKPSFPAALSTPARELTPTVAKSADWPGFRGPTRDSVVRGTRIDANWAASPPKELWRHAVGPGWSSFAVSGDLIYTQEQRGDDEIVACYRLATGEPVWRHQDPTRFYESNAGPGPRGTPTLHGGRVYTFGATGVLNALDALNGAVVWTRNAATDTKRKIPEWGLSSSPLCFEDILVVAVSGTLAAYDAATGAPRWTGAPEGGGYSSPQLIQIDGTKQFLFMSGSGITSFAPTDGKVLWQHAWMGFAIVQPAQIENGEILISTGDTNGVRRINVAQAKNTWSAEERWTSNRMKPYFNDHVLHRGHVYGFNSGALACLELEQGERKWKGGHYGSGQLLLLADQDLLMVLSEQGDLALVAAKSETHTELARTKVLEGKTWNHPVLVGDILLVRNDQEMAALRLAQKRE